MRIPRAAQPTLLALACLFIVWTPACPGSDPAAPTCVGATDGGPRRCDRAPACDLPHEPRAPCDCPGSGDCAPELVSDGFCPLWNADLAAANRSSLRRFALSRAQAVVTGTFGSPRSLQEDSYVPMTIQTVHYVWSFLEGLEVMVRIHPERIEALPDSQSWVVALTQSHPNDWEQDPRPVWGNVLTLLPEADAGPFMEVMGYRVEPQHMVAVVRVAAQDEYRTRFEVVNALSGTFPASFEDNWYASWNLPYPAVSEDEQWIVSVLGLTEYPDDLVIGSVLDIRAATPAELGTVGAALLAPGLRIDRDALIEKRDRIRVGIRFHHAPWVTSSLVSGMAGECCTGAGGTFIQHDVFEALRGEELPPRFITGGHGYYGDEDCGDAFLHGLESLVDPAEHMWAPFDCLEYPLRDSWDAAGPAISSSVSVRLPGTTETRERVEGWLSASAPLYQLYPLDTEVPIEALEQDPMNAPWSLPMDAAEAFLVATHIVLLQIEEVEYDEALDAQRVRFSTTFSIHEYDHLERHDIELIFRCGDPRLLEVGAGWIGGLVMVDPVSYGADQEPVLHRSFLVPGALVPESELNSQLESTLATDLN